MCSFCVKMNSFNVLFVILIFTIAINESSQSILAKRLSKRSTYNDSPRCRECERDCRSGEKYGYWDRYRGRYGEREDEREHFWDGYVCGRRVSDGVLRTFESRCLLECHNDCYVPDRLEYRMEHRGECREKYGGEYEGEYEGHDRKAVIVHDSLEHTNIPTCQKARQCYCGTICQPICARSMDSDGMYAVFHNPCRLSCTNQCSDEHEGFEPASGHICRQAIRDHRCDFGRRG